MSKIHKFPKAPFADKDYTCDYSAELDALGDSIASSVWIVPSNDVDGVGNTEITLADGVTVNVSVSAPSPTYSQGGTFINGNKTVINLDGGTLGLTYRIYNRIVTVAGRKYEKVFDVFIQVEGC